MSNPPPAKRKCLGPADNSIESYYEGTLKFTLPDLSKMTTGMDKYFPIQYVGGFPWSVVLDRSDRGENQEDWLGAFICCENQKASNIWYCECSITFILVNHDPAKTIRKEFTAKERYSQNDNDELLMGVPKLEQWKVICNPTKGFIKDDAVSVEVHIKIKSALANNFRSKIAYDFFTPSEKADVVLSVEGKDFYVSKQLLAIQSTYFDSLFYQEYKERNQEKIPLNDVSSKEFESLLRIVYRMDIATTNFTVEPILRLADMYDMKAVIDDAERTLLTTDWTTLERKLLYADQFRLHSLLDQCLKELTSCTKIDELTQTEEYNRYSAELKVALFDRYKGFCKCKKSHT